MFEKEKATVVTIREGEKLENYDIRIPSQLPTNVIQGVLLHSNGKPVSKGYIDFKAEATHGNYERDVSAVTDEQGRFSFKVLQGTVGWLRGYISLYFGKYTDCPQANELLKGTVNRSVDVDAEIVKIEVTRDIKDIKLIVPFAFCSRKE